MTASTMPPEQQQPTAPAKFGSLAWTAVILGIVGLVGSPVLIFNNITAIAAGVGVVLGAVALFGSRKVLALIGVGLCVAAVAVTVSVQRNAVDELDRALSGDEPTSDSVVLKFGQTEKGQRTSVKIDRPKRITTAQYAVPEGGAKALQMQVTVRNLSDEPLNAGEFMFSASIDGAEADEVFDSAHDLGGTPDTDVLPGKAAKFPIAFLGSSGDLVVQVRHASGDTLYYTRDGRVD